MRKKYCYAYPKADHTVDAVVFSVDWGYGIPDAALDVLLIQRGDHPFKGKYALPGGFVNMEEDLDTAVWRELKEETGLVPAYLEQLYTFSAPDRDPRGRVISTAYMALVNKQLKVVAGSDAAAYAWVPVGYVLNGSYPLAFDHKEIVQMALNRLQSKLPWQPIGIELLGPDFSLTSLQRVYEFILGHEIDKRNFRAKVKRLGVLEPSRVWKIGKGRPAQMYRFNRKKYLALVAKGVGFEV